MARRHVVKFGTKVKRRKCKNCIKLRKKLRELQREYDYLSDEYKNLELKK